MMEIYYLLMDVFFVNIHALMAVWIAYMVNALVAILIGILIQIIVIVFINRKTGNIKILNNNVRMII